MSLEQASLLAQIVSAVAVIASLVFVGIQLQHATKAVRASSSQAHSAMYHAIIASITDSAEFARIWRESLVDPDSQSADDRARFLAFTSTIFRYYESSRVQWLRGQLDDEHWHTIDRQAASLSGMPGIQAWWLVRRHWHSEEFQRWFEGLEPVEGETIYGSTVEDVRNSLSTPAAREEVPATGLTNPSA